MKFINASTGETIIVNGPMVIDNYFRDASDYTNLIQSFPSAIFLESDNSLIVNWAGTVFYTV